MPNRPNWRHKSFISVMAADNSSNVYLVNIKQFKDNLGTGLTEKSITEEIKEIIDKDWELVIENSSSKCVKSKNSMQITFKGKAYC